MSLRFKNRIALYNTAAAAVATLLLFLIVYFVVHNTSYKHLDSDISLEKQEVSAGITWENDSLLLNLMPEWEEREHQQAEVSPVFMQVADSKGHLVFRTANLQNDHLVIADSLDKEYFFNIVLNGVQIRQGQFPIINDKGKLLGQLDIGILQGESSMVLANLRLTLIIAFPLMLLVFYLATSWAASRSIAPVHKLILATGTISDNNLSTRLPLPPHKDEIHQLGTTINDLLGRIEMSLTREKQITADISHELRTPITSIRGTLEVLIRKPRDPVQYNEKITQVIGEVDDMNQIIDQLLQLSRLDAGNLTIKKTEVGLSELLHSIRGRWYQHLKEKNIFFKIDITNDIFVQADRRFLDIVLDNIVSNAIKYGDNDERIVCTWSVETNRLSITNNGPGIPDDQIPYLFDRFYRTDASRSSQVKGYGLGLSIVKRLADLQQITLGVSSQVNAGTTFILGFNN
ncbi:MAG TPA: HAMP domain-containing sensor histidine kinase [Prolixibacteraceae bacterium]|jgi:signal transduction histidine kinase